MTAILDPVKIATVSNLSVSSGTGGNVVLSFTNNSAAIDNGLLYNGDRVLVKDQTNPAQNGIYVVNNATQLIRATDMAYNTTATASCIVFVQQGSVHADTGWVLSSNTGAVSVGTSELTFLRFSVNRNVIGEDLEVTLIYREELGRPLTNIELDNNFKYLATALTDKLDIQNFTADQIATKLNTVTAEEANLNANRVRGYFPSAEATADTITLRDSNGNLTATTFFGNLQGSASQLNGQAASFYRDATNINAGILAVARGGTGASTASAAVTSLGAVHINGDTMTGKLTLVTSGSSTSASLRIPNGSIANDLESGDLWSQDNVLKFRSGTTNKTIAFLEAPQFEAPTLKDNPLVSSNDNAVASTKFTHDVVDELASTVNTALGTKAPIESPSLTGTPNSTTPTQSDNSTRIATTAYVTTKVTGAIANVYSKIEVDGKITGVTGPTTRTIKQVDDDLQNWLQYNGGTPVGAIVYYPASTIPFGWMECDGRSLDKNTYASLFAIVGYTYGGSGNTFKLPDLRGEFVRGWDHGRGVDENRVLGSWQKGTLNVTDPNYGSHNTAGIIGRTNYSGGTTGIVDKQFVGEAGQDYVTRDLYPNVMLHWFNGTNAPLELGTSGFSFGATRPRNVALVPCIRAFGGLDDPNQILAQNVINDVAGKVNKVGDIMTGFLTLHAAPTQDLHASTKKYVDDKVANIDISTTAVLKSGSTMSGFLTLSGAPTQNLHASTKKYVDDKYEDLMANSGTPVGSILYYPSATIPFGWMQCDGRSLDKTVYSKLFDIIGYTYGGSGNTFKLPDLRGEFVRGWDAGRGVDSGRVLGSFQEGTTHLHIMGPGNAGAVNAAWSDSLWSYKANTKEELGSITTEEIGANGGQIGYRWSGATLLSYKSRPRNVAFVACIKVFGNVDDPSQILAQNVINDIAGKVNKAGDTMSGFLTLHAAPTQDLHASTKKYVDDKVANIDVSSTAVMKAGSTMTGTLTLSGAPTQNLHASTKKYVDDKYEDLMANSGTPVGSILYYPSSTIPFGWMQCDGRSLDKIAYAKLFDIIGYTYGGSGNTFKLPDLRGEFVRGWDNGRGVDSGRALNTSQSATAVRILIDQYAQGSGAKIDGTYLWKDRYPLGTFAVTGSNIDGFVTPETGDASLMRYKSASSDPTAGTPSNPITSALGTVNVASNSTYYRASTSELSGNGDNISFMVRPRNVALVACIKVFGNVDDPNQILAQNVINDIAGKVNKAGDTMSGFLTLHAAPAQDMHASTKKYVDDAVANIDVSSTAVMKAGSTMTGILTLSGAPTQNLHAATKAYVDTQIAANISGGGSPVGSIVYHAAQNVPVGWMECDGRTLDKNAYSALFSVIGYTYGGGGNNFKLPDLRGEFIRGWDHGRGADIGRAFGTSQRGSQMMADDGNGVLGLTTDTSQQSRSRGSPYQLPEITWDKYDGLGSISHAQVASLQPEGLNNYYHASQDPGYFYHARPRNVALVACIKVFGTVDDPNQILAQNVITDIAGKVNKTGDTMTGPLTLSGAPTQNLHAATKAYVDSKVGSNYTITSGNTQYAVNQPYSYFGGYDENGTPVYVNGETNFTNIVGNWENAYNFFDVFPPSGKSISNLVAFLPSIAVIHYEGRVDGNDSLRCTWGIVNGDRIRVWVQNTEQRSGPAANWIAFWS